MAPLGTATSEHPTSTSSSAFLQSTLYDVHLHQAPCARIQSIEDARKASPLFSPRATLRIFQKHKNHIRLALQAHPVCQWDPIPEAGFCALKLRAIWSTFLFSGRSRNDRNHAPSTRASDHPNIIHRVVVARCPCTGRIDSSILNRVLHHRWRDTASLHLIDRVRRVINSERTQGALSARQMGKLAGSRPLSQAGASRSTLFFTDRLYLFQ